MPVAKAARVGAVAVGVSAVLAAGGVRLVSEARSELAASEAAWSKGDAIAAACGQLAGDVQDRTPVGERIARQRTIMLKPVPAAMAVRDEE